MRKITQEVTRAFIQGEKLTKGNTHTDGTSLYLHGNEIAKRTDEGLMVTNAGWSSNTTKERLNGLPSVSVTQKNYQWYLNGKAWNGEWVRVADFTN